MYVMAALALVFSCCGVAVSNAQTTMGHYGSPVTGVSVVVFYGDGVTITNPIAYDVMVECVSQQGEGTAFLLEGYHSATINWWDGQAHHIACFPINTDYSNQISFNYLSYDVLLSGYNITAIGFPAVGVAINGIVGSTAGKLEFTGATGGYAAFPLNPKYNYWPTGTASANLCVVMSKLNLREDPINSKFTRAKMEYTDGNHFACVENGGPVSVTHAREFTLRAVANATACPGSVNASLAGAIFLYDTYGNLTDIAAPDISTATADTSGFVFWTPADSYEEAVAKNTAANTDAAISAFPPGIVYGRGVVEVKSLK